MGDVISTVERLRAALQVLEDAADAHLARIPGKDDAAPEADGPEANGPEANGAEALLTENKRLSGELASLREQVSALSRERDDLREENRTLSNRQTDALHRLDTVIEQVESAMGD